MDSGEAVPALCFYFTTIDNKKKRIQSDYLFLFIDYEKEFDTVTRGKLWKVMKKKGISWPLN